MRDEDDVEGSAGKKSSRQAETRVVPFRVSRWWYVAGECSNAWDGDASRRRGDSGRDARGCNTVV